MQPNKRAKRHAKRLFRMCLVDGALDEDRATRIAEAIAAGGARDRLAVLAHLLRLVRLDLAMRTAIVESATALSPEIRADIAGALERRFGTGVVASFTERPSLIGGVRIQVGCNVYDASVRAGLAALEKRF